MFQAFVPILQFESDKGYANIRYLRIRTLQEQTPEMTPPPRAPEGVRLSLGAGVHWEHRGGEEQDAGTGIPRGGEENHGNGDGQFSF